MEVDCEKVWSFEPKKDQLFFVFVGFVYGDLSLNVGCPGWPNVYYVCSEMNNLNLFFDRARAEFYITS